MSIQEKIEEIRKKPEHIRLRYVWGLTFFSLAIVILIWIISISAQKEAPKDETILENQQQLMESFQDQKKSLQDTTSQMKDLIDKASLQEKVMQEKNKTGDVDVNDNLIDEGFSGN